jgi:hypothetical protein
LLKVIRIAEQQVADTVKREEEMQEKINKILARLNKSIIEQ